MTFGGLLASGRYSDLALECEGTTFRVHKAIVCPQSPVLAAACDGQFEEATTNVIHVRAFDAETARRMLEYLYTQAYDDHGEGTSVHEDSLQQTDAPSVQDNTETEEDEPPAITIVPLVSPHIKVNAIADYYNIRKLQELANGHIRRILATSWSPYGFSQVIEEAKASTMDKALHAILCEAAVANIHDLVDVKEKITSDDFANSVIHGLVNDHRRKHEALSQRVAALGNNVSMLASMRL